MSGEELLRHTVSEQEYYAGRAGSIAPKELEPGVLYTARLLVARTVSADTVPEAEPVEALVELEGISEHTRLFAAIRYVNEDGQPEGEVFAPELDEEGILHGRAAPLITFEGYFLNADGSLEDELDELLREVSLPVHRHSPPAQEPRYLPYQ